MIISYGTKEHGRIIAGDNETPTPYSATEHTKYSPGRRSHQIDRHSLQTTMPSINDALRKAK